MEKAPRVTEISVTVAVFEHAFGICHRSLCLRRRTLSFSFPCLVLKVQLVSVGLRVSKQADSQRAHTQVY